MCVFVYDIQSVCGDEPCVPVVAAGAVHLWRAVSWYVLGGWLGERYHYPGSAQLSPPLLLEDINKNKPLTTKQLGVQRKKKHFILEASLGCSLS